MNLINALNWRYAVREFSSETIAPEQLQQLLDASAREKKVRFDTQDMVTLL